jgi:HxlR-like helix-turn-helix
MVLHLADRLGKLSEEEMITRAPDPSHKQKATYTLTEKSIALVPVLVQLGVCGSTFLPASEELSVPAIRRRSYSSIGRITSRRSPFSSTTCRAHGPHRNAGLIASLYGR